MGSYEVNTPSNMSMLNIHVMLTSS